MISWAVIVARLEKQVVKKDLEGNSTEKLQKEGGPEVHELRGQPGSAGKHLKPRQVA